MIYLDPEMDNLVILSIFLFFKYNKICFSALNFYFSFRFSVWPAVDWCDVFRISVDVLLYYIIVDSDG
jgi:hypothetical protein